MRKSPSCSQSSLQSCLSAFVTQLMRAHPFCTSCTARFFGQPQQPHREAYGAWGNESIKCYTYPACLLLNRALLSDTDPRSPLQMLTNISFQRVTSHPLLQAALFPSVNILRTTPARQIQHVSCESPGSTQRWAAKAAES